MFRLFFKTEGSNWSFQALEDDGCSGLAPPHNLQCIPQYLALRPSVKFEFSVDQAYLHVTLSHAGTRTDAETIVEESLMDIIESESRQSRFSDQMQCTAWSEAISTQPPNVVGTLNMYSTSRILQRCEDQIFGVVLRSMIYVLIFQINTKDDIGLVNIQTQKHCNLVLLQHILGIEFVRHTCRAMRGIFPMRDFPSDGTDFNCRFHFAIDYCISKVICGHYARRDASAHARYFGQNWHYCYEMDGAGHFHRALAPGA